MDSKVLEQAINKLCQSIDKIGHGNESFQAIEKLTTKLCGNLEDISGRLLNLEVAIRDGNHRLEEIEQVIRLLDLSHFKTLQKMSYTLK